MVMAMARAIATPTAHLLLGTSRPHTSLPCAPLLRPLRPPSPAPCQFPLFRCYPLLHPHGASLLLRLTPCRSSSKPQAPSRPPVPVRGDAPFLSLSLSLADSLVPLSHPCPFVQEQEPEPEPGWPNLEPWNVPWDGTTTAVGMLSWFFRYVAHADSIRNFSLMNPISR